MNADMLSAFTEQLSSMSTDDDVTALTNLQEAVLALGNATETETPKISSFAGLFSDDGTDFSRDVDDYISDVETLMNAQKSLQEGTFDSADIANLVTDFPELAGQTDILKRR